ncbi:hypothetical protein ABZ650_18920 [Streptomyces griseoviridis]
MHGGEVCCAVAREARREPAAAVDTLIAEERKRQIVDITTWRTPRCR